MRQWSAAGRNPRRPNQRLRRGACGPGEACCACGKSIRATSEPCTHLALAGSVGPGAAAPPGTPTVRRPAVGAS